MIWVQRNIASLRLVPSSLTSASHTWVVRPECDSEATQAIAPCRVVAKKFDLSSIVVKLSAPSGSEATVPYPAQVSASAMIVAACKYPFGARNSGRISTRASADPCSIRVNSSPNNSGNLPLPRSTALSIVSFTMNPRRISVAHCWRMLSA